MLHTIFVVEHFPNVEFFFLFYSFLDNKKIYTFFSILNMTREEKRKKVLVERGGGWKDWRSSKGWGDEKKRIVYAT